VLAEAIFMRGGSSSVLKREALVRGASRRGMPAAAPAAAAGILRTLSFWQQLELSVSCLQKEIRCPLLNDRIPCPGKRKQIRKITVLPVAQGILAEFGGLEGDAVAHCSQVTAWCGAALVSREGGLRPPRLPGLKGTISRTSAVLGDGQSTKHGLSPLTVPLIPNLMCHL